jgi:hypothetical protein
MASEPTPFDRIMSIAMPMAAKAANGDYDAAGEIVEALSTALARTIVRVAHGDPAKIEEMLTGAEHYMASEASDMANTVNAIASGKRTNG